MPDSPTPQLYQHCQICHRDTSDLNKHWTLHHQGSGGFATKCADWNCPRWRIERNLRQQHRDT